MILKYGAKRKGDEQDDKPKITDRFTINPFNYIIVRNGASIPQGSIDDPSLLNQSHLWLLYDIETQTKFPCAWDKQNK